MTFPVAIAIGAAQALALIPGISRSGISISAGRIAGLDREAAARFAFLMATPDHRRGGHLRGPQARHRRGGGDGRVSAPLIVGMVAAFVAGMVAIGFLLRYLRTRSLNIFVATGWSWRRS